MTAPSRVEEIARSDRDSDVIVVGAGHNGLVAAARLARAGLRVHVYEQQARIGGASVTEQPFSRAPNVRQSTGAYLLGLMPPEVLADLDLTLPLARRDPHYFLPTRDQRYLLFGSDEDAMREQCLRFFSKADWNAHQALQRELGAIRRDIAPTWVRDVTAVEAESIEHTADRYVRQELRAAFVALCRGSVGEYLERFGFESELLKAMYATTDGFSGLSGGWDTPGSGMNFLIHNMCRLPGSAGTWMVVRGGMGAVTEAIAACARKAGAAIDTNHAVVSLETSGGAVQGIVREDGTFVRAKAVVVGTDPFRLLSMSDAWPASFVQRVRGYERDGMTMKVNLCLSGLPQFSCLPETRGQHHGTIHLLPDRDVLSNVRTAFAEASAGELPSWPTIEWYIQTTVDPSLGDAAGRHSSALFVQWVPYELANGDWSDHEDAYVDHLLSICDRFAPGTSRLAEDRFVLTPPKIESYFGMHRGHIHHVDNTFGFADRLPYRLPLEGVYACGAGCHPGGSVIGAAGYNAATAVLSDFGFI